MTPSPTLQKALQKAISNITFQGHRINDKYTINKRVEIYLLILRVLEETTPPPTFETNTKNEKRTNDP